MKRRLERAVGEALIVIGVTALAFVLTLAVYAGPGPGWAYKTAQKLGVSGGETVQMKTVSGQTSGERTKNMKPPPAKKDPRGWYLIVRSYYYVPHEDGAVCGRVDWLGGNRYLTTVHTTPVTQVHKLVYGEDEARIYVTYQCGHEPGVPFGIRGVLSNANPTR